MTFRRVSVNFLKILIMFVCRTGKYLDLVDQHLRGAPKDMVLTPLTTGISNNKIPTSSVVLNSFTDLPVLVLDCTCTVYSLIHEVTCNFMK